MQLSHKKKGISFMEVLIVIAIMTILMGVVLVNFSGSKKKQATESVARELVGNIRAVQAGTLLGEQPISGEISCGQGVYYSGSGSVYRVYAIKKGAGDTCEDTLSSGGRDYGNGEKENMNTRDIPGNITIDSLDVFFEAPYGEEYSNGSFLGGVETIHTDIQSGSPTAYMQSVCVYPTGEVKEVSGNICP